MCFQELLLGETCSSGQTEPKDCNSCNVSGFLTSWTVGDTATTNARKLVAYILYWSMSIYILLITSLFHLYWRWQPESRQHKFCKEVAVPLGAEGGVSTILAEQVRQFRLQCSIHCILHSHRRQVLEETQAAQHGSGQTVAPTGEAAL